MNKTINNDKFIQIISKNIKHFRILNGYSQQELEQLAGLGENYITNLELAKKDIKISTLIRISNVLNISLIELFNERKKFVSKKRIDSK